MSSDRDGAVPGPQTLFVSHGGGPLPLLGDPGHADMIRCMAKLSRHVRRPQAIVVVSAHWEADVPSLTSAAQPGLIYDYSGFPPESYALEYPAPGAPALATRLDHALREAGFAPRLDSQRGFDHGLFVPLKMLFPQADIPCIQVSLMSSLDAAAHYALGVALGRALDPEILLLGSGFSFHNLRAFFTRANEQQREWNLEFEAWLIETCSSEALREAQRQARLVDWATAPGARFCHPREEHLLPIHVCAGAARRPCSRVFELQIMGLKSSMYLW